MPAAFRSRFARPNGPSNPPVSQLAPDEVMARMKPLCKLVRNVASNNLERVVFTPTGHCMTVTFEGNGEVVNTLELTPQEAQDLHADLQEAGFRRHLFMTSIGLPV